MNEKTKHSSKLLDPTAALQDAINNLEKFAEKSELALPNVDNLAVEEGELIAKSRSPLRKTIDLARCFISATFSEKTRAKYDENRQKVKKALLNSIEIIKKNHLILEKFSEGNPEEQQLVASTMAAIKRYNAAIDMKEASSKPWSHLIAHFVYKHSGLSVEEDLKCHRIELPQVKTIRSNSHDSDPDKRNFDTKVNQTFHSSISVSPAILDIKDKEIEDPLLKQEADAIRMKTNTLLRLHGICFPTISEALTTVRAAPIQASLDRESSTSTLYLTLNVIPGMIVRVKGSFKRDPQSATHSRPIPDSFLLSWKTTQTGFPYPSQYVGWALADPLIPPYPLRLDMLPLLRPLYHTKQETSQALLPNGNLIETAKQLFRIKKQIFKEDAQELLGLHRQLSLAILGASTSKLEHGSSSAIIDPFYAYLETHSSPLEFLAEIFQLINENFIVSPYTKLQEEWIKNQNNPQILGTGFPACEQQCKDLLAEEDKKSLEWVESQKLLEPPVKEFIRCFGTLLGTASKSIVMQHLSETFGFVPPDLNEFEVKIQIAAFKQLNAFLEELNQDFQGISDEEVVNHLRAFTKEQLLADIALFQAPLVEQWNPDLAALSHELKEYFQNRFKNP